MSEFDPRLSDEAIYLDLTGGCSRFVSDAIQHAVDRLRQPDVVARRELEVIDSGEGFYSGVTLQSGSSGSWELIRKSDNTEVPRLAWMVDDEFAVPVIDFVKRYNGSCSYLAVGPTGEDNSYLTVETDDISRVDRVVAIRNFVKGCATSEQIESILNPMRDFELQKHAKRLVEREYIVEQKEAIRAQEREAEVQEQKRIEARNKAEEMPGLTLINQLTLLTDEGTIEKRYAYKQPAEWDFETEDGRPFSLAIGKAKNVRTNVTQDKKRWFARPLQSPKLPKQAQEPLVLLAIARKNIAIELGEVGELPDEVLSLLKSPSPYDPSNYREQILKTLSGPKPKEMSQRKKAAIERKVSSYSDSTRNSPESRNKLRKILMSEDSGVRHNEALQRARRRSIVDYVVMSHFDSGNTPDYSKVTKMLTPPEQTMLVHLKMNILQQPIEELWLIPDSSKSELRLAIEASELFKYFTQTDERVLSVSPQLHKGISSLFAEQLGPYDQDLEKVIEIARGLARLALEHTGVIDQFAYQRDYITMNVDGQVKEKADALAISIDLTPNGDDVSVIGFRGDVYTAHPNNMSEAQITNLLDYLGALTTPKAK